MYLWHRFSVVNLARVSLSDFESIRVDDYLACKTLDFDYRTVEKPLNHMRVIVSHVP